jgi:hypothetical protein
MDQFDQSVEDKLVRFVRYRDDPWEFLKDCVFTLDQTDQFRPIKAFPSDYSYLYVYVRCWQRHKRIAVPKSRRMFMSWVNIALYLWDTMFHQGRLNAFVSRKEEAADELVRRAKFIYEHIPQDKIPKDMLPRMYYKYNYLIFPELHSQIQGFPQGADQLRQFTFSGILGDEMAFWEDAQRMYASSMPTLEGGGRFTGISSAAPGFFMRLVFDQLGSNDIPIPIAPATARKLPAIQGVEIWINAENQFLVFQLHYSANPAKRDPNYRKSVKSSMPLAQYMQEYEIEWYTYVGMPVYRDYDERVHGELRKGVLEPHHGLPLLRGWDFGLTPACVVAQLQGSQLVVLWEMTEKNMGAKRFVPQALAALRIRFPEWADMKVDWRDYGDASGAFRVDTDENTCFKILVENKLVPRPSAIDWEARKGSVEHFLLMHTKEGPGLKINIPECPVLARGFKGGYRYPEKCEEIEPAKIRPLKDEHSHPHDALQAITSNVVQLKTKPGKAIPSPSYSWSQTPNIEVGT